MIQHLTKNKDYKARFDSITVIGPTRVIKKSRNAEVVAKLNRQIYSMSTRHHETPTLKSLKAELL